MEDPIDGEQVRGSKPRKTWLVILLSLLQPGLGQIYNGQVRKAAFFYSTTFLTAFLATSLSLDLPVIVMVLLLLSSFVFYALAIIDAGRNARRLKTNFVPKRYNRVVVYLLVFIVFGLGINQSVSAYVKANIVQAFRIPAASMRPTLQVGDHLFVDKSISDISRGNIIVFEFPPDEGKSNPRDFIKRVVGLPGDRIRVEDKQLFVNDQQLRDAFSVNLDSQIIPASAGPRDNMSEVAVPDGAYFVMGDNRDYSFDSRFWGFVEKEKIKGQAVKIYWSWDGKASAARWERIGQNVE